MMFTPKQPNHCHSEAQLYRARNLLFLTPGKKQIPRAKKPRSE